MITFPVALVLIPILNYNNIFCRLRVSNDWNWVVTPCNCHVSFGTWKWILHQGKAILYCLVVAKSHCPGIGLFVCFKYLSRVKSSSRVHPIVYTNLGITRLIKDNVRI